MTVHLNNDQIKIQLELTRKNHSEAVFSLDVDLSLPGTGITAIFGHSGSGKTTLLRCFAGLDRPVQAQIQVNGEVWQGRDVFVPVHKRRIGYVFQEDGLFPHLNVAQNIAYGIKRTSRKPDAEMYEQVVSILELSRLLAHFPSQLSGGERQRAAIARALLINPDVLLMDEPLAALDRQRKQEILHYLEQLKRNVQIPVFYVSHSMNEVTRLADHVVILQEGRVLSQGSVTDVFSSVLLPEQLEEDTGVILEGEITEIDTQWHLARVTQGGAYLWVKDAAFELHQLVRLRISARDISISLSHAPDSSILNKLEAKIIEIHPLPGEAMSLVALQCGAWKLVARLTDKSVFQLKLTPGLPVWAQIKSVAIVQ